MSKCLKRLKCKRQFFVNYFVVSLVLMLLACLMVMLFKHNIYAMISHCYSLTYHEFIHHVFGFMSLWKAFIVQFALAPAIAFWWLEKHKEYQHDDDDEYNMRRM